MGPSERMHEVLRARALQLRMLLDEQSHLTRLRCVPAQMVVQHLLQSALTCLFDLMAAHLHTQRGKDTSISAALCYACCRKHKGIQAWQTRIRISADKPAVYLAGCVLSSKYCQSASLHCGPRHHRPTGMGPCCASRVDPVHSRHPTSQFVGSGCLTRSTLSWKTRRRRRCPLLVVTLVQILQP